jgi:hypothetical protein
VINDVLVGEPFNELVVAGRYGGIQAVVGYGSAVAATVSDDNTFEWLSFILLRLNLDGRRCCL